MRRKKVNKYLEGRREARSEEEEEALARKMEEKDERRSRSSKCEVE